MSRPALVVHGGAGTAEPALRDAQRAGCAGAVAAGWEILDRGGSALDAVCTAVAVLEDAPEFNAGVGSCLTSDGTVEMDASVMDGNGLRAGAVAAVRTVRHPIRVARALLEEGRHVLLAGSAADTFAAQAGIEPCRPEDLVTARQHERWRRWRTGAGSRGSNDAGTVGAVAVDHDGHVAAATSTGGIFAKRGGRIGDSALIGAGTYADDACGAASATGHGEAIIRVALAYAAVAALQDGTEPTWAARHVVTALAKRTNGSGGIIIIDALGRIGYAHNTPAMLLGYRQAGLANAVIQA